jgi:putative transposase
MKTSKFTDEQIALALRQAEAGTPVGEICAKIQKDDGQKPGGSGRRH